MQGQPELLRSPFATLIGTEWISHDPDAPVARLAIREELTQPQGLLHGGVLASLAETVASAATYAVVQETGMVAMGQQNSVTFLRPLEQGHVEARGRPLQRGRTTWVWDVDLTDAEGRLCAVARVTIAVRPERPS